MKALPGDLPALAAGGMAALARCLTALESAPEDPALIALLAGRRHRQVQAWASAQLIESIGTLGHGALSPLRINHGAPFASLGEVANRARRAVHEGLKNR